MSRGLGFHKGHRLAARGPPALARNVTDHAATARSPELCCGRWSWTVFGYHNEEIRLEVLARAFLTRARDRRPGQGALARYVTA